MESGDVAELDPTGNFSKLYFADLPAFGKAPLASPSTLD
jgi:hypothetical protein